MVNMKYGKQIVLAGDFNLCFDNNLEAIKKSFIFQQNHISGIINRRLGYLFISKKLQDLFNKAIILPAFKTDHSSVSVIISNNNEIKPGTGL